MSERRQAGLLDTCVVIDLGRFSPEDLPVIPHISTPTLAELGIGLYTADDQVVRAIRTERLQRLEAIFRPISFTAEAARRFTHMAGLVDAAGRDPKPRRFDLMIAAVASVNELPLYTRNTKDFVGLDSVLDLVAV